MERLLLNQGQWVERTSTCVSRSKDEATSNDSQRSCCEDVAALRLLTQKTCSLPIFAPAAVQGAFATKLALRSSLQCVGLIEKTLLSSYHPISWPLWARISVVTVRSRCPCPTTAG